VSENCCHGECQPQTARALPARIDRAWLSRVIASGLAIVAGFIAAALGRSEAALAFDLVAIALSIATPASRALRALRARDLDINVLMLLACAGAGILGDWPEAAVVVWLFSISQWLEAQSFSRAQQAIRSLMTLAPAEALVRRNGIERVMPADDVQIGDVVIIRPGERAAVDGRIVLGETTMDQAPITGESWPVDKIPGDEVFAGSINGHAAIEVEAQRPAAESTLAQIGRLIEQAQRERAPIQTLVDRFARRYTPAVVGLAIALAVIPPLVIGGGTPVFAVWVYRALTLLVVACPCALVISTPVSMVSALAAAAREGVLIKGGAHLERLGSVRCIAFDKTGTLTRGRVTVTDVLGVDGVSMHGVLSIAAALESRSEHPIGRAIVSRARGDGLDVTAGEHYRALPGLGAEAQVSAALAVVGNHRLFEERQLCTPSLHDRIDQLTELGSTPVLVSHDGAALGAIGLADDIRENGAAAIAGLRAQGIRHVVLLTGDSRLNASALAAKVGLDQVHAELMPADKVALISSLRAQYGPVAMVGDGVNDAPALASADVGIAMGVAGTDVALETADVALMSDDLEKLPYAIRLGRETMRNIRLNVAIALGLKLAFIGLAVSGVATLWMAILADTGASLLVTANSLRLLRIKSITRG